MKKSKFRIVEDFMLFLSQKQHIFGLCFIISLIFITFAYENSNLNAGYTTTQVAFEDDEQLVRTFYETIGNTGDTYKNKKLVSCKIDIGKIFGISENDRILNKNLDYLFSDFKNNIKYSIDLYGIDKDAKLIEEKALFKVYTTTIYNPKIKINVCTYDDNGSVLTGNENQSEDKDYILCDKSRMKGGDCAIFPSMVDDGSLKCVSYNQKIESGDGNTNNQSAKNYCYSDNHICNMYKNIDKNIFAVDKEFIDQYLENRDINNNNMGKYFYLFYKDSRPTDEDVKKTNDTVNCFQKFYNCDLAPYWNINNIKEKLKVTGNGNINADKFVNVIIYGSGINEYNEKYYNNEAFENIVNDASMPLFVEDTEKKCCLENNDSCSDNLCFSTENKNNYIDYFKNPAIYKYIKNSTVRFFIKNISNQTCKNYLPECTSTPTITPLYEKIDGKININDNEEQNSLYRASKTSKATCLYAEGTNKNNVITYSTEIEDSSKSYCSDLLMNDDGTLKLKYENGLYNDNCFLKSCIDLNNDELTVIAEKSNTNNVYCSPYRYLRDYDKIGISLDLKFLPISDGEIIENYYCDNYNESEENFVFANGIDHEKKENCYLRRCVSLSEDILALASEKRTASLFDIILKNVDNYISSHSDSDFSSIDDNDIKTIERNELKQYCENRVFFIKSGFVEDNLNLLNCSEFVGKTVKSANYEDIIFTKRENLGNFLCVNFRTIMKNDIASIGDDSDNGNDNNIEADDVSFVTSVFSTFSGNINKVKLEDSSILSDFKFNDYFIRYKKEEKDEEKKEERNICKGVDNAMIYISGDVENLSDNLNFNNIIDITVNKYVLNRCKMEENEDSERYGQLNKCRFGDNDILNTDGSNTAKIDNIKNNLLKKYFKKNIVDCADYGSGKEDDDNTRRVVDCKLMDFLKNNDPKKYKDHYYIDEMYDDCETNFKMYNNESTNKQIENLKTFYADEGKLFLPVPLTKGDSYKENDSHSDETQMAVACGYEGSSEYDKFRKQTPTVGCYPLADDFAYIDMATNYKDLRDKEIINVDTVTKPKDFSFNYIPVFTRYVYAAVYDGYERKCISLWGRKWCYYAKAPSKAKPCGERKGSSFKDKAAILTSGNIDTSGEFKYISNDNGYLTAAGNSSSSNFYKYGGGRYGNNICIFTYKDLSNCITGNFNGIVGWGSLEDVLEGMNKTNCKRYKWPHEPGCGFDSFEIQSDTVIKYIDYNTYQLALEKYKDSPNETDISGIEGGIKTVKFKKFRSLFSDNVFNYGGSVKDYYPYNDDYDHGILAKFNILSSYRGDVIRNTSTQGLRFNTDFYETLNNRYEFSNDNYYKGLATKDIIEKCGLQEIFQNGQFNPNVLNSDEKLEAARKCLKQYNADFFAKNPNEKVNNSSANIATIQDVIAAPLKNRNNNRLGDEVKGRWGTNKFAEIAAIKVRIDNNGKNFQPFKMIEYIGNQKEYNEKNINCYFDKYGFPISDLKYCRGIFTTKEEVTNFNIYDENSDMKNFLPESSCLKLPLASAPQPYFNLATSYNTPSLFSPIFILTKYIKWNGMKEAVDFKANGVSGIVTNFFEPKLYFSYYFTSDESNKLFKNTENNDANNWSYVSLGKILQEKLSTLRFSSKGTGERTFIKSFAGKKSFILNDKGFYYPIMCVSTYVDTKRKSLVPEQEQCDPYYKGEDDTCVVSDVENFVCVDRMVPTYENIYMKLDRNFSFRTPYINAAIYDRKTKTSDEIPEITKNKDTENTSEKEPVDRYYADPRFVLEGNVEGNSKAIDDKGFSQLQQFGLTFERSLCSQLDIEYFDYLEKLNMLAEDNESQRAIYTAELEKINEVIKPNCLEAQGEATYLNKIDITEGECKQTESSTATADIPTGNVLLPINNSNLYLQCKNEAKIGKILDRIKILRNPIIDKGHKEICVSDSNFKEIIQANNDQGTFKYSDDENQVVVFNSTSSTNIEDNKCLLDAESRKNASCRVSDFVYVEDNTLSGPIITDGNTIEVFVSENDGSIYRVKEIDCRDAGSISDTDLANVHSFTDTKLEKIKFCYKGGYNYSENISKSNGETDYSCKCMKKGYGTSKNILKNGIFSSRAINKRELGLCVDIDSAIPTCEAISYKNPAADSNTSYEEQVKNMKFSRITSLMSDLFKNHSGYEDERWEHIWRSKQKMFNSIGSYSGSSRSLGHAEFARYPYCDDVNEKNCFGKSKVSVGTCSGFYKNGARKVLAECVKIGDKYEFRKTNNSGECIPDSCVGVGYTDVFNDLNTNEESLLNNNENDKNFTQAELASYSNVQNSLKAFNTTNHQGEISRGTIDNRGLFNGFAAWKETKSDIVAVKQDAVECFTGYGPAGTNYIVHKFFPYIKNVEDSIDFREDFSVDTNEKITNMHNLLKKQYEIFNELVNLSKGQVLKEGSLIKAIVGLSVNDFIYLHDNLPVRFCNQLGNWEESRDIYNNALKNGDKNIDSISLRYYNRNNYYVDLKKGKKYLNNTILSQYSVDVPVFERVNTLFNDGVSDYNDSINTKYCERLFCQALSMEEATARYGSYDIYDYEYNIKNSNIKEYVNNIGSSDDEYYVTLDVDRISKYTPWRHLGGANWEAISAPRNHSNELKKGSGNISDPSNTIIDNIIVANSMDRGSTKTMYLKKVNGVCDNKYGYYNRGTKFVLDSFSKQFETLKHKVLSQPDGNNRTTVNVEEINGVKIGGVKTNSYEVPFRTCSSIGLWSGVYNSCYRACEMIDMYHTNFNDNSKYNTFKTGKSDDENIDFDKKDSILSGDVISFNLYPSFDRFRINNDTVKFSIKNEKTNQTITTEYKLGDYLTGGASWPKTIVGLKAPETKFDDKENLRYVEVEGICDTTNPYGKTFVSNVDPNDYTKSLRPKRRCYENGTWGPIENLCVLFNACNELSLNVLDLSNLLLQNGDVNKMNKIINKKLLAQADCLKPGSDKNCYEKTYNVDYINRGFETNGLPVEEKTIQNSIKEEDKKKLFSNKSQDEINSIISSEIFTVNAGVHVNPTKTKESIYVPLNLKKSDNNFAFTYADSNLYGCETNDEAASCSIDETKSVGYKNVDFYKMQCNFGAKDSMSWKFASPYLGNYIYPIICDKNSGLGNESKALNRTRLFNNKNLKNNIDNLLMYTKESNFHVLSYLINEGKRSTMFRELTNCELVSDSEDKCDKHGTMGYSNQNDFSDFNVSLPINKDFDGKLKYRELSSYQHITYCDERYFYNEDPDNRGNDKGYLYRPIVVECSKPDEDSKKGKFTMLNVQGTSESFSAEQCYPRYCGRDLLNTTNKKLSDVSGSKFTGNTVQNNWTLSHNSEYEKNKGSYGEIKDDHKITDYMSNIIQCDKYTSKSRLNTKANAIEIDKAYVLNFEKSKNVYKGAYEMNNTIFTFYSANKNEISNEAWIKQNYVNGISTVCVADQTDIKNGVFNGISLSNETVKNAILKHKLASLDLSVFKNGQVKFCTKLGDSGSCQTVLESELASGKLEAKEQGTTTNEETAFANTYCVPMACDGEVDLDKLDGFVDPNKNTGKIYLDYDKYQIGDYVIIEDIAGDFADAGNTTDEINGSKVYVMSTYLSDSKGVKTDETNNWYINQYQNGKVKEVLLNSDRVDNAYGLVCKKGYDQYFDTGYPSKPTTKSISKKTFGQCDLYIEKMLYNPYASKFGEKDASNKDLNKYVEYTDTLKNIIAFIDKESVVTDNDAKIKIDGWLKAYIEKRIDSIRKSANGNFSKYVDYGKFANDSNIKAIKETTMKKVGNSNKYYIFAGTQTVESSNTNSSTDTNNAQSNNTTDNTTTTTTITYKYIVSADGNTKFSSENMTCGSINSNYLFETSLCDYDGKKYIKIEEHKTSEPSNTTIEIQGYDNKKVALTYQSSEAMYILQNDFVTEYNNAFENAYTDYIKELLGKDKDVAEFYNNHADFHITNTNKFDGNVFAKYNTYNDLKEQLTKIYKSIVYLGDGLFLNKNIRTEIYNNIMKIDSSDAEREKFEKVDSKTSLSVSIDDDDDKIMNLNINVGGIINDGKLSLYTLDGTEIDKHGNFVVSLKNYRQNDIITSIEDLTDNIVIKIEKDLMTYLDVVNFNNKKSKLKNELNETGVVNFTDNEIDTIMSITECPVETIKEIENEIEETIEDEKLKTEKTISMKEQCIDTLRMNKAKEIWGIKGTNNKIIEDFEAKCSTGEEKEGEEETKVPLAGCTKADRDRVVTIDMNRINEKALKEFKIYIERLVYANKTKLEGLYDKRYREALVDKKTIEDKCVVFSDKKINECYKAIRSPKASMCDLLETTEREEQFERLFIKAYKDYYGKGDSSSSRFDKGFFIALQCGVDGKWKLVDGGGKANKTVSCKPRCNGEKNVTLDPDGAGKYKITMKINNLRYGSSGSNEVAGVGMYCSRSNDNQSEHGKFKFACVDDNKGGVRFDFFEDTYYPGYHYHYRTWEHPAEKSTCVSRLYYFDSSTLYYRTASLEGLKRNNSGVILTCPETSNKRIIHHVMRGHSCCLDSGSGRKDEYPACHREPYFKCSTDFSLPSGWKEDVDICDGFFDKTARISYDIKGSRW